MNAFLLKEIKECSGEHPARILDFDVLVKGLFDEVDAGNISIGYHPMYSQLAIFKYTQDCVTERNWNKFTLMARGLILDLEKKVVVATPLIKFFNMGELEEAGCSFIEPNFVAFEKLDGSLGIVYFFDNKWMVATCGSFISEQAQRAEKWLHDNVQIEDMDVTNTYLVEIIYPENRIVVTYDFSGLVLLSVYDKFGLEYTPELLESEASYLGIKKAKIYDFKNMNQILELAKTLDHNQKGFVIKFGSGVRLKIKGDEYVRIHRLISRVTPIAVWEALLCGDDLDRIKKDLPEELERDFDIITALLKDRLDIFIQEVETMYENTKDMSNRDLGIYLQQKPEAFEGGEFPDSKRYIFMMRKGKFYEALRDFDSKKRKQLFKVFKPKANVLDGYSPSSAVNRFSSSNLEG
jgi:RNA ligase